MVITPVEVFSTAPPEFSKLLNVTMPEFVKLPFDRLTLGDVLEIRVPLLTIDEVICMVLVLVKV